MAGQSFKRSIDTVAEIYRYSEGIMAAADIDESVRFPIHLAIEELFVNLVNYNPGVERDILIEVEVANKMGPAYKLALWPSSAGSGPSNV